MMSREDCERAAEVSQALRRIKELQSWLAQPGNAGEWRLEVQATDGDEDGGTIKYDTIIPAELSLVCLEPIEKILCEELKNLGVSSKLAADQ